MPLGQFIRTSFGRSTDVPANKQREVLLTNCCIESDADAIGKNSVTEDVDKVNDIREVSVNTVDITKSELKIVIAEDVGKVSGFECNWGCKRDVPERKIEVVIGDGCDDRSMGSLLLVHMNENGSNDRLSVLYFNIQGVCNKCNQVVIFLASQDNPKGWSNISSYRHGQRSRGGVLVLSKDSSCGMAGRINSLSIEFDCEVAAAQFYSCNVVIIDLYSSPSGSFFYYVRELGAEISKKFAGAHMSDSDQAEDVPRGIGFSFVAVSQVQVTDSIVSLKNSGSVDYYGLSVVLPWYFWCRLGHFQSMNAF
ncbi:hypothetical protein WA026_011849 [Henosepilachna vigintioctopunctata]|uniref:Uncharacterized protein n=1 Tax=Henosepilachna vigintioctopunctata TaxID=420089 RepID=A0AAW1UC48_9CUCU